MNNKNIRFNFGKNWKNYLNYLSEQRIVDAENTLKYMFGVDDFKNKKFLDAGCGSGIFSLAARRLGANVYSFDFDVLSVKCTLELKKRFYDDDNNWIIEEGSILNNEYLKNIGKFDFVYCWGVLHHTGDMWKSLSNIELMVSDKIFISIYNDQGIFSKYWKIIKETYNKNLIFRYFIILLHAPYLFGIRLLIRKISGKRVERGMTLWYDMIDWLGGLPFEVAKPEEILDFYLARGFNLIKIKTSGGNLGCNEYVFIRC